MSWKFTSLQRSLWKMFHYIFDYNYGNSWQLLIICVPLKTRIYTLRSRHKQCHFNRMKSTLYLVKLKIAQNGRPLTAVRSVEPIVPNFRRKSFSVPVRFFPSLLENSFSGFPVKNIIHSHVFLSEIHLQIQYG